MTAGGGVGLGFCYRHPNRETGVRCVRCDRPICPECMRTASVGFHCPDDAREGARSIRAPRTSVGAKIMASPPYVTGAILVLNIAAYLATGLQPPATLRNPAASQLFIDWQLYPPRIHDGDYHQLITSAFLHQGLLHIAANMLALIFVGPALERLLGSWRFALLYLLCALGGSAAVYAFGDELIPTVGASGAIFGLFGACLLLARRLQFDLQLLIGTLVLNFAITFSVPGISQFAHVGGFVTGLLCALAIGGVPTKAKRIATRLQAGGLSAVLALIVVVVAVRSATFA